MAEMDDGAVPGRLFRSSEIRELLGISRRTFQRWLSEGRFPPGVRYSERTIRWHEADVVAFLTSPTRKAG